MLVGGEAIDISFDDVKYSSCVVRYGLPPESLEFHSLQHSTFEVVFLGGRHYVSVDFRYYFLGCVHILLI